MVKHSRVILPRPPKVVEDTDAQYIDGKPTVILDELAITFADEYLCEWKVEKKPMHRHARRAPLLATGSLSADAGGMSHADKRASTRLLQEGHNQGLDDPNPTNKHQWNYALYDSPELQVAPCMDRHSGCLLTYYSIVYGPVPRSS